MADHIKISSSGQPHPYHLVNPSIWPLLTSFAAGFMAVGAVLYMHDVSFGEFEVGAKGLIAGLLAVVVCSYCWWRDIVRESVVEKAHTPVVKTGLRYGMLLFIASEVMFFAAFFWAFFDSSLFPSENIGSMWPPKGLEVVPPFDLPLLMTMILLLSGCSVTWAHHAILHNKTDQMVQALAITVALGVVFLGFQVYEYGHVHFGFTDTVYASTFFMATGFHGLHVLIGAIFLFVCYIRAKRGHFTADSHFGFEAAAWYWHFVDVVWLFLYVAVYIWGNAIGVDATAAG